MAVAATAIIGGIGDIFQGLGNIIGSIQGRKTQELYNEFGYAEIIAAERKAKRQREYLMITAAIIMIITLLFLIKRK